MPEVVDRGGRHGRWHDALESRVVGTLQSMENWYDDQGQVNLLRLAKRVRDEYNASNHTTV